MVFSGVRDAFDWHGYFSMKFGTLFVQMG